MPRKKSNLKTVIGVVLDESGSMQGRAEETIKTFNDYFDEIEKSDPTAKVTVVEFSDMGNLEERVRLLVKNESVKDMTYLDSTNYRPRGVTPLLDAVGVGIRAVEKEKADRYLFVILTDGLENASRDFSKQALNDLIKEKEASDKWTFVFLGAGIDAWAAAQFIGMTTPGTVLGYSGVKGTTSRTGQSLSSASADYLGSNKTSDKDFLVEEKKKIKTPTS